MAAKKTPIYDSHVEQGGRIVEFAGYLMPVSFEGIVAEHQRVRTKVGLFDVSHMGEIDIKGDGAAAFTDSFVTNRSVTRSLATSGGGCSTTFSYTSSPTAASCWSSTQSTQTRYSGM